jgi:hypothetical protein
MTRFIRGVLVCAVVGLPVSAWAQPSDVTYCSALVQKYERYVGDNGDAHRSQRRDAKIDSAITQCPSNSASAIPVLEQALRNAKVDLPPRG